MATIGFPSPSSSSTAATAPDPVISTLPTDSHPLPKTLISSLRHPPNRGPLFSSSPPPSVLGKLLHPPPAPPSPQDVLFPAAHRAFPRSATAALPGAADQTVAVANPAGYIRDVDPTGMTFATQARPFVFGAAAVDHTSQTPTPHAMRPPHTQPVPPPFVGPTPVGLPAATLPEVTPFPIVSASNYNNSKKRDKSGEDTFVMINDRKVRLLDGGSGSLYSLCRSWVRNGFPHEIQPDFRDDVKRLPRPLPPSMVDTLMLRKSKGHNEADDGIKEEDVGSIELLSAGDLLKGHIKHAKRVRAHLRKEHLLRIARCKQRLALLLPPLSELGRNDAASGN